MKHEEIYNENGESIGCVDYFESVDIIKGFQEPTELEFWDWKDNVYRRGIGCGANIISDDGKLWGIKKIQKNAPSYIDAFVIADKWNKFSW